MSRYREELAAGHGYPEALARAVSTAGRTIAFSGAAVAVGLSGLLFFEGSYLSAMGIGGAIVVVLAVLFALTFLPALLAVLGPRIHAGRLPFAAPRRGSGEGFWHRTASWVMRRPLQILIPTLALLLWMGSPFLHLRMVASDVRVLPPSLEARHGYDILRADFPDQAQVRVLVLVRFPTAPALNEARVGALFDLSRRIAAIPNVSKVESIVDGAPFNTREDYQRFLLHPPTDYASTVEEGKKLTVGERVVLLSASTDLAPESKAAGAIVRAIREHRQVADGELLVGGQIANDVDASHFILSHTPPAVGFVVSVTLVVLFLLFGSLILPFKALAMNVLSISASFGALVWIFQDGHLFIHDPRPVEPALSRAPLLLHPLRASAMDYEVPDAFAHQGVVRPDTRQQSSGGGGPRTHRWFDHQRSGDHGRGVQRLLAGERGGGAGRRVRDGPCGGPRCHAGAQLARALHRCASSAISNWWAPAPLKTLRRWLGFPRDDRIEGYGLSREVRGSAPGVRSVPRSANHGRMKSRLPIAFLALLGMRRICLQHLESTAGGQGTRWGVRMPDSMMAGLTQGTDAGVDAGADAGPDAGQVTCDVHASRSVDLHRRLRRIGTSDKAACRWWAIA